MVMGNSIRDTFVLPYLPIAATALALYLAAGTIYRLYLSPVSKFPGSKLAALTFWHGSTSRRRTSVG